MCQNGHKFPLLIVLFLTGLDATAQFPFTIVGDRFYRDGAPTFLAGIGYQPLEPGQAIDAAIRLGRIEDDLKRLEDYGGGSDTLVLRVYAQPTSSIPNRMPSEFYQGAKTLDFWIIRDIFFYDFKDDAGFDAVARGHDAIDNVFEEVLNQGGLDHILAWEIGNEFGCNFETGQGLCDPINEIDDLESFIETMTAYIKTKAAEPAYLGVSDWVTWGSFPPYDPLLTDGTPVLPDGLDFISFNAYSYEPERLREHQGGAVTGTPFGGYLNALGEAFPGKPLVLSETGLADSSVAANPMHMAYRPYSPQYRKGALTPEGVAEGLAERYWDARLGGAAGMLVFEWNDEWHKEMYPETQSNTPEESFGLLEFDSPSPQPPIARNKIQHEVIRDLFSLDFDQSAGILSGISRDNASLVPGATTTVRATVGSYPLNSLRFVWHASRGHIIGASKNAIFQAPPRALGSTQITLVAIAPDHKAAIYTTTIAITPTAGPDIDIRTFGVNRATGFVSNIDLSTHKVVVWVEKDGVLYAQPYNIMKSIWVGPDGFWWTHINNDNVGSLHVWLAPRSYVQPNTYSGPIPGEIVLAETVAVASDEDSDHLDDAWEIDHFGSITIADRFDDSDMDGARNDEEFLRGTDPNVSDNDSDSDGLEDTWELRFFLSLDYIGTDDPDGDGIDNEMEQLLWLHPNRVAIDADRDTLPDTWEVRALGSTGLDENSPFGAGFSNAEAYSLGFPSGTIWVEFGSSGNRLGTPSESMPTLQDAIQVTRDFGTIHVKAGASQETITISRPIRIVAEGGTARIGSL